MRLKYWKIVSSDGELELKCIHPYYCGDDDIKMWIKPNGQWTIHNINKKCREYHEANGSIDIDEVDDHWEAYDVPEYMEMLSEALQIWKNHIRGPKFKYWKIIDTGGWMSLEYIGPCNSDDKIRAGVRFDGQWTLHNQNEKKREYFEGRSSLDIAHVDDHWEGNDLAQHIEALEEVRDIAYHCFGEDNHLGW